MILKLVKLTTLIIVVLLHNLLPGVLINQIQSDDLIVFYHKYMFLSNGYGFFAFMSVILVSLSFFFYCVLAIVLSTKHSLILQIKTLMHRDVSNILNIKQPFVKQVNQSDLLLSLRLCFSRRSYYGNRRFWQHYLLIFYYNFRQQYFFYL